MGMISLRHVNEMRPDEVRALIRKGEITGPTAGMAGGFTQANLVILKKSSLLSFCCFASAIKSRVRFSMSQIPDLRFRPSRRRMPISAPIFRNTAYTGAANWRMK